MKSAMPPGRLTVVQVQDKQTDPQNPAPGTSFVLDASPYYIGNISVGRNHIKLTIQGISRAHAVLEVCDGKWWISDAGSTNGSWINGKRVSNQQLSPGDIITMGPLGDPEQAAQSVARGIVFEFAADGCDPSR